MVAGIGREEYLLSERTSETKHEWRDGETFEVPGVGRAHSQVQGALAALAIPAFSGTPYEFNGSDVKVRAGESYLYPDGTVALDAAFAENDYVLLNPIVIFEVLSPSTSGYDRGEKFRRYDAIPSLRDYVLITTEEPVVEVLSRGEDGWTLRFFTGLDAVARIPSVGLDLPLGTLYERILTATVQSS